MSLPGPYRGLRGGCSGKIDREWKARIYPTSKQQYPDLCLLKSFQEATLLKIAILGAGVTGLTLARLLTDKGQALGPVLKALYEWGEEHR